jgi:hypothetical protein
MRQNLKNLVCSGKDYPKIIDRCAFNINICNYKENILKVADNKNGVFKIIERRRYERHAFINAKPKKVEIKVIVEGVSVNLLDFSIGGLYIISETFFPLSETENLSIDVENKGKIDLIGTVVRTRLDPDSERWGIAIDLSHAYNLRAIRKI